MIWLSSMEGINIYDLGSIFWFCILYSYITLSQVQVCECSDPVLVFLMTSAYMSVYLRSLILPLVTTVIEHLSGQIFSNSTAPHGISDTFPFAGENP